MPPLPPRAENRSRGRWARAWPLAMSWALVGCSDDGDDGEDGDDGGLPACIDFDVDTCSPQYSPEFDRIYTETLQPICGVAGGACHGQADASGAQGGLHIADVDATHATLLGDGGGPQFVVPGDPSCSLLMVRLNIDEPVFLMPPGQQPLDENVRCSIAQWIADGAQR